MAGIPDRLVQLGETIVRLAQSEDKELQPLGKSIFHVPEIAFAYLVGKAIAKASTDAGESLDWEPESRVVQGSTDRIDLILRPKRERPIAIEFKAGYGVSAASVRRDIRKLRQIGADYDRLFCGLMGQWGHTLDSHLYIKTVKEVTAGEVAPTPVFDFTAKNHAFETTYSQGKDGRCWWCGVGL
jgi:hypothetical protein